MIIEIRGTGTHNKGAELMLRAIVQELSREGGDVQFAVDPHFGPYAARARYGLLTKLRAHRYGRSRIAQQFMSASFRRTYGLVADPEVDAVLDASGFAFGDAWGPGPAEGLERLSKQWRRRGIASVLLPQAFGPFEDRRVRDPFRRALEKLPLVFARDRQSYEYLQDLGVRDDQVRMAPDFTNVVPGVCPEGLALPARFACVVPNIRMLDMTNGANREAYVSFLADSIRRCRESGIEPVFIYHDPKFDRNVAAEVQRVLRSPVRVIEETDPVSLKGIISRAWAVIGSRYHALIAALSCGVPSIGTSWSHKYRELFADYGCEEWLVEPSKGEQLLPRLFERLSHDGEYDGQAARLRERARGIRESVDEMFVEVRRVIHRTAPSAHAAAR